MRDLINKRVGLFPATGPNAALLDAILSEYEIAPETVQHIMLSADDLPAVVSQNRVDALFSVGPFRGGPIGVETSAASWLAFARHSRSAGLRVPGEHQQLWVG